MTYTELLQFYFQRSNALQWYWTVYILVIGGLLAFTTFRQHKDFVTTSLITVLYVCFAYKNLGAIEATLAERNAILSVVKEYTLPPQGATAKQVREIVEPTLQAQDYADVRNFHVACDLLTIAALWAKEWRRKKQEPSPGRTVI
jgi:hypothetical protein